MVETIAKFSPYQNLPQNMVMWEKQARVLIPATSFYLSGTDSGLGNGTDGFPKGRYLRCSNGQYKQTLRKSAHYKGLGKHADRVINRGCVNRTSNVQQRPREYTSQSKLRQHDYRFPRPTNSDPGVSRFNYGG